MATGEATAQSNPNWSRDELILALDLYVREGALGDRHPLTVELSQILNSLPIHTVRPDRDRFRNANSVALKLANFQAIDPSYHGKGMSRGSALDAEVWASYRDSPELTAIASELRAGVVPERAFPVTPEEDEDGIREGRLLYRRHRARERNRALVTKKKRQVLSRGEPLACEVCGFDYAVVYGNRGEGYIECHHLVPLAEAGESTTSLTDLALVCANCHRMLHRSSFDPAALETLRGEMHAASESR